MRPKAVITNWVHDEVIASLEPYSTVVANQTRVPWTRDEILDRAGDASALMTFMPDSIDADFLDRCPGLRIVACALKGPDNFDAEACSDRGIWLTVVPDLLTAPTAELAVGLMIGLARSISAGDEHVRSGEFNGWRPLLYGTGLDGSTVGLIGLGAVGRAIAERLVGFGSRLLYHDPAVEPATVRHLNASRTTLEAMAAECDYLVVACPLTETSKHLINKDFLRLVRQGSHLINISRGSVVDEEAVADALLDGSLAGYAADVFEMEDWLRPDRPRAVSERLLARPNVTLFTPHLGSAVDRVRRQIALEAAGSIVQCLNGELPKGAVNDPINAARQRGTPNTWP